jgi:hypothetical protein
LLYPSLCLEACLASWRTNPDCKLIPRLFACQKTALPLCLQKSGLLLSNSLYTDLIVNISGGRHIAAALNTFGVGDTTTRLLVVAVNASEANWECLNAAIHGVRVPVSETAILGSEAKMKKAFKVSDLELTIGTIADAALCKGALNVR